MLMSCQASPVYLPEVPSLASSLGYAGRPPSTPGNAVDVLVDIYPQIPRSDLLDVYEQTGCDLDRTLEFLPTLLGVSRPNSPARQDSAALEGPAEQLWAHAEGSDPAAQPSTDGLLAEYHILGSFDDSAASSPAHQRAANQPRMAHPDLFPAEVKRNCAQVCCVDHSLARRQPQNQQQAMRLESLAIASLVARHRKWWPKRGVSERSLARTPLHQRSDHCSVRDTSSSPTKLLNHTIKEAFGASASQSVHPGQVYDDLVHPQPQHNTTDRGGGLTRSSGTPAGQVSQTCKARPTTSQLCKQPVEQCDSSHATWQLWPDCSLTGSASTAFADHPTDVVPESVEKKQHCLQQVFSNLSSMMIANALRESDYDLEQAKDKCLQLLQMEGGVPDWSESSDADTSSVAAESLAEVQSPRTWSGTKFWWQLDEAEALQELNFEEKVDRLCNAFPQIDGDQIHHCLETAHGNYDVAYATLLEDLDFLQEQEAARLRQEQEDRSLALELQEEQSTSRSPAANNPFATTLNAGRADSSSKADDWLVSKDPKMKPKLEALQTMFPRISRNVLQERLAAAEGHLPLAVQHLNAQLPADKRSTYASSPLKPTGSLPAYWAASSKHPITPPPGMPLLARAPHRLQNGHAADARPRRHHRSMHNDIYVEARQNFHEAQQQIFACKQKFHAATRAGNTEQQKYYSSQLEYWQAKALEEKQRAHKKIYNKKNADVSNTFKVDLHALHVDEALYEVEKCIKDLSKFKCTWNVEAIVGKGLHSVNDPKLLPAVKQRLQSLGIPFWEVPGMVVFKIVPVDD